MPAFRAAVPGAPMTIGKQRQPGHRVAAKPAPAPATLGKPPAVGRKGDPGVIAPESFYRDLVWTLRNGVIAVTHEGRIAVMNEAAYRILGFPHVHDPEAIRTLSGGMDQQAGDWPVVGRFEAALSAAHLLHRCFIPLPGY